MPPPMGYSLVLFKEENYLAAKYKLVKGVRIIQVFFLTLLTVHQEDINRNHYALVRSSGMFGQF